MIYVGIDVAKDKHDCFAISSDGEVLFEKLTIKNTLDGFNLLINSIFNFENDFNKIKIGLEATKPKVVSSSLTPATKVYITRTVMVLVIFYCLEIGCNND